MRQVVREWWVRHTHWLNRNAYSSLQRQLNRAERREKKIRRKAAELLDYAADDVERLMSDELTKGQAAQLEQQIDLLRVRLERIQSLEQLEVLWKEIGSVARSAEQLLYLLAFLLNPRFPG